jgi:gamma-glutamyl hydrolase
MFFSQTQGQHHHTFSTNAGTQWHPEKPTSEFGMVEVPHTLDAVRVSQHLANYFIDTGVRGAGPASDHH